MSDKVTTASVVRVSSNATDASGKLSIEKKNGAFVEVTEAAVDDHEKVILAEDQFTEKEYKRLRLKIDLIMMPILMIIFGLNYSDKTSLSSGVIFGLKEDTDLKDQEYNNLNSFFYLGFAVAQFPMGWTLQRFPLGKALSATVVIWGAMVMCLAACNNYWQLSLVRVLLGWFESVIIPGFAVLTASWYLRREQTLRQTLYYAMNTFFGIIFGVGIYYIALDAQKKGGLAAWRVINLFLGGTTVGMGFICLVFIGTPDEVWWLSKREKLMAKARIVSNATGGGEQHPWSWAQVKECFKDQQLWHALAANFLSCVPNGGLTAFGIIINQSFGFDDLDTILFSLPGYAVTCVSIVLAGVCVYYKPHSRFPIAIVAQLWTCFILLFVGFTPPTMNKWIRWAFYMMYPLYSISMFLIFPLMTVNVAGRSKKTIFGAACLMAYCIGNVVGSQIFVAADAPRYHRALAACAVCLCVNAVNIGALWWYYHRVNKKRDVAFAQSGLSEEEREYQSRLAGENDLTDKENVHFRYSC